MAEVVSDSVKLKLKELFESIDIDKSGHVSVNELSTACSTRLSLSLSERELNRFTSADTSGDGSLDFSEFCQFYVSSLREVFDSIDSDRSGYISASELQEAFRRLGYHSLTEREIVLLLRKVDTDSSGSVDFGEFCEYFVSLPSPSVRAVVQQWATGLSIDVGTDLATPPVPPPSLQIWRTLLAGGVAGVVSRTATAPLEKIKLLAQTRDGVRILPTLQSVLKFESWRGLFAGNGLNCLRVLPFSALVCLAYANIVQHFPLDSPTASAWTNSLWRMAAGATAGSFATVITHPIDVVRAQVTVSSTTKYTSLKQALITIYRQDNIRGLYRGLTPTLLAIAPFMAMQQSSYDVLKHRASLTGLEPSVALFLTCGSLAGVTAQTAIYPLEVVRRRLQVGGREAIRNLSLRQLFGGLTVTYLKVMPSAAISLLVRDALLGRLK